jgi:hypothetical protein
MDGLFFDDDEPDPEHPLGVLPAGNLLFESQRAGFVDVRARGLGWLSALDDESLLSALEYLDARGLVAFGCASRAAYAFAAHEDTWRALVLRSAAWDLACVAGSWRATGRALAGAAAACGGGGGGGGRAAAAACGGGAPPPFRFPRFPALYSGALHHAHRAATARVRRAWCALDNLPRRARAARCARGFARAHERGAGRPALLPGAAARLFAGWARGGGGAWAGAALAAAAPRGAAFHCGGFDAPLAAYAAYAARDAGDQALYLFDADFAQRMVRAGAASGSGSPRAARWRLL